MEIARQRVVWTTALGLSTFPKTGHWVVQVQASSQIVRKLYRPPHGWTAKEEPRLARRRKSGEAKGRPSHIGRSILSQMAGLRDDLLQHIVRNTRECADQEQ